MESTENRRHRNLLDIMEKISMHNVTVAAALALHRNGVSLEDAMMLAVEKLAEGNEWLIREVSKIREFSAESMIVLSQTFGTRDP